LSAGIGSIRKAGRVREVADRFGVHRKSGISETASPSMKIKLLVLERIPKAVRRAKTNAFFLCPTSVTPSDVAAVESVGRSIGGQTGENSDPFQSRQKRLLIDSAAVARRTAVPPRLREKPKVDLGSPPR